MNWRNLQAALLRKMMCWRKAQLFYGHPPTDCIFLYSGSVELGGWVTLGLPPLSSTKRIGTLWRTWSSWSWRRIRTCPAGWRPCPWTAETCTVVAAGVEVVAIAARAALVVAITGVHCAFEARIHLIGSESGSTRAPMVVVAVAAAVATAWATIALEAVVADQALVVAVEVDGLDLLEVSSSQSDQRSLNNSWEIINVFPFQLVVVVLEVPLVRTPGGDPCKQPKVHLRNTVVPMWPSSQRWPRMCAAWSDPVTETAPAFFCCLYWAVGCLELGCQTACYCSSSVLYLLTNGFHVWALD